MLRPRPRPPEEGHRGRSGARLRAFVRDPAGQGAHGPGPEESREERRNDLSRRRPGPRGRGHLLAPAGDPEAKPAEDDLPPGRVPRDHEGGRHARRLPPGRHRPGPRQRAAGPPHHRPPRRLRGLGPPLVEALERTLGGTRPDRHPAHHRGARERAGALRPRPLLLGSRDPQEGRDRLPGARRPLERREAQVRRDGPASRVRESRRRPRARTSKEPRSRS